MNEIKKEKKKIMFLITGSDIGGAEIVVKNLIFSLDPNKFLPVFVSIRPLGKIGAEISKQVRVISLEAGRKFNPMFIWRLFILMKKEKPDILHCHLFHANLIGRIIGRIVRTPFIISTVHSDNFGGGSRYFLLRITDRLTDLTIAVSKKIAEDLISKKISPANKLKVIYNGVNDNSDSIDDDIIKKTREDLKINNSYPVVLTVGRLSLIKGHIYLIEAIKILKEKYPDIKLLLIGDGPERVFLEKEMLRLDLGNNIIFLGELRNINLYYKLADFFVLPSINEGFGLAAVEAMSNRLLVIASKVGGVPEIIKDGVNGFLFTSKNPQDLAGVISRVVLMSDEEKNEILKQAYNNFKDNFCMEKMLSGYLDIYNKTN